MSDNVLSLLDDSDDDDLLLGSRSPVFKKVVKKELGQKPAAADDRKRTSPATYETVLGRFDSTILGTQLHSATIAKTNIVKIQRDLDNQFDVNAMEALIGHKKVGHLPNEHAAILAPLLSTMKTNVRLEGTVTNCLNPDNIQLSVAVMHKGYRELSPVDISSMVATLHNELTQLNWTIGPAPPVIHDENNLPNLPNVSFVPATIDLTSMDWESQQQELDDMFELMQAEQLADLPDIEMPKQFQNLQLFDFQKKGIKWLYKQEKHAGPPPFFKRQNGQWFCSITHCRVFQPPKPLKGAILADDMGLGKTLQTLGLILCNPPENQTGYPYRRSSGLRGHSIPRTTLIVCPVSVIGNWSIQINKHVNGRTKDKFLKVARYHGPKRENLLPLVANNLVDILITSYNTMSYDLKMLQAAELKKKPGSERKLSIFDLPFHRVVLDEAHIIRSSTTGFFKATSRLQATHKLCLTGTPFVNKPSDIQSLLAFLEVDPMRHKPVFDRAVTIRIKERDERGLSTLRTIMACVALRRNKAQVHSAIKLVDKTVENRMITFPPGIHKSIHDMLYVTARAVFVGFLRRQASGGQRDAIADNYMAFLELILRVRQACCHGGLVPEERRENAAQVFELIKRNGAELIDADIAEDLLAKLRGELEEEESAECAICTNPLEDESVIILKECKHIFCDACLQQIRNQVCPMCRVPYSVDDMISKKEAEAAARSNSENEKSHSIAQKELKHNMKLGRSPKHQALLDEIDKMEYDEKAVIFSQWTSNLDLIEAELFCAGHTYTRIDGSMSAEARTQAMEKFDTQGTDTMDTPRFILCSLMACGTGINLTRGNVVFLMDCWWNAAAEQQAQDRVHRIGQSRAVRVYRFLMEDSIEMRMMALQETKSMLGKGSLQKLHPEEKKKARMTTLHELFQVENINEFWDG